MINMCAGDVSIKICRKQTVKEHLTHIRKKKPLYAHAKSNWTESLLNVRDNFIFYALVIC